MTNHERGPRVKPVNPADFTLAGQTPVRRRILGKPRRLTPQQVLDLAEWSKARRALGNNKTKAAELGISEGALVNYLHRIHRGDFRGRGES
jgi:hypothetical protein